MNTKILCIVFLLGLISCGNNDKYINHIGYEEAAGFVQNPTISSEQYHSGSVSVKVNPDNQYGLTFKRRLGSVSSGKRSKIRIRSWVRSDSDLSSAKLVCAIDSGETNLFWSATDTKDIELKPGIWKEMKAEFEISKASGPDNTLVIYGLNTGKGSVWIDDISFTIE